MQTLEGNWTKQKYFSIIYRKKERKKREENSIIKYFNPQNKKFLQSQSCTTCLHFTCATL